MTPSHIKKYRASLRKSFNTVPGANHTLTMKRFLATLFLATIIYLAPAEPTTEGLLAPLTNVLATITSPWLSPPKPPTTFDALAPRLAHYLSPDSAAKLDPLALPVKEALVTFNKNPELRAMVARVVIQESAKHNIEPSLILGIMAVENTTLNPRAKSHAGAKGLMQVMPFHAGRLGCGSTDLEAIDSNICHGVRVFTDALRAKKGNVHKALLAYNGCVKAPNCHKYPNKVLAAQAKARTRMTESKVAMLTNTFDQ